MTIADNNQREQEEEKPRAIKMAQGLQQQHQANDNNKTSQQNKKMAIKELEEEGKIKGDRDSQQGGEEYEEEEPRQGS